MQTMFLKPGKGCPPPTAPDKGELSEQAYKAAQAQHKKALAAYDKLPPVKVRDPRTGKHLAEKGETKPRNAYWLRRLKDGDVTEAQAPQGGDK